MPAHIEDNVVALLTFTLSDEDGTELEVFPPAHPTAYLHGHGNLVKGLEDHLAGKQAGDSFEVTLDPANGYGVPSGNEPQAVPRKEFRKDANLVAGMSFVAQGSAGQAMRLWVTKSDRRRVWVTADHPWAGKTVTFVGKVLELRVPSATELAHGHAHGPGGKHH